MLHSRVGECHAHALERLGPDRCRNLGEPVTGEAVILVAEVVDRAGLALVPQKGRGMGFKIEHAPAVGRDVAVADEGAQIQAQVVLFFGVKLMQGLQALGRRIWAVAKEDGIDSGRLGVANDQRIDGFADQVIHLSVGEKVAQASQHRLQKHSVADVDVGNHQEAAKRLNSAHDAAIAMPGNIRYQRIAQQGQDDRVEATRAGDWEVVGQAAGGIGEDLLPAVIFCISCFAPVGYLFLALGHK